MKYSYQYIKMIIKQSNLAKEYRKKYDKSDTSFEVTRLAMKLMEYILKKK